MEKRFGPYLIVGELGRGAMGVVWRGYDPALDRQVAIKEPFLQVGSDEDAAAESRQRYIREARAAARLTHPNIVTVYAAGEYDGRPAIVMELVDGQTLQRLLRDGPVPEAFVLNVMDQLLDAVGYAHSLGVVHRDLKPDNIFVTASGQVKLADFGIAHISNALDMTTDGSLLGTPSFMSPEQVAGGTIDGRSDIFSLGSIAYTMLTGRNPFEHGEGSGVASVLYRIVHDEPRPPKTREASISDAVNAAVMRALEKDPEARFATAHEMRVALCSARERTVIPSRVASTGPLSSRDTIVDDAQAGCAELAQAVSSPALPTHVGCVRPDSGDEPASGVTAGPERPSRRGGQRRAWILKRLATVAALAAVLLIGDSAWQNGALESATKSVADMVRTAGSDPHGGVAVASDWTALPTEGLTEITSVDFIDENTGWMSASGLPGEGSQSVLLVTRDGGKTWEKQLSKATPIIGTSFFDRKIGWAVTSRADVYRTTDGGGTWASVSPPSSFAALPESAPTPVVTPTGPLTAWAISGDSLVRTSDGGTSWVPVSLAEADARALQLVSVHFASAKRGFVVGIAGDVAGDIEPARAVVFRSDDLGGHWSEQVLPGAWVACAVQFVDAAHGWIGASLGAPGSSRPAVFRTEDGGLHWTLGIVDQATSGSDIQLWDVGFVDTKTGWACGDRTEGTRVFGVMYRTDDGGKTWVEEKVNASSSLRDIDVVRSGRAWVTGGVGVSPVLLTRSAR